MINTGVLNYGYDIDIQTVGEIKIRGAEGEFVQLFDSPKTLVFMQMSNVTIKYMGEVKRNTGKPGMNKTNLEK